MRAHMAVHSWQLCARLRLAHTRNHYLVVYESTSVSEVNNIKKVPGQNLASQAMRLLEQSALNLN